MNQQILLTLLIQKHQTLNRECANNGDEVNFNLKLTQGCFSFVDALTDKQILKQVDYALACSWALSIEYTDDPHPRNNYWSMWGLPLFDVEDAEEVLLEVQLCRKNFPGYYIKLCAFDNTRGVESCVMSFLVHRPEYEPGFRLVRQEAAGRKIVYTMEAYAPVNGPATRRY
jgi:ribulose-bisphosphate carboxylase small chain